MPALPERMTVEPITSTRNARVRELAKLSRARVRREQGRHLVEGPNAVREALLAGVVEEVFLAPGATLPVTVDGPAGPRTTSTGTPSAAGGPGTSTTGAVVTHVSHEVLDRLADATTPQGVVAVARTPRSQLADVVGRGLLVVLDELADPGNAGTILRTADAAGASGLVLTSGSVDPYAPKTVRAAAGSTYHLPVVEHVGLTEVVAACRDAGQRILGLDGGGELSVFDLERPDGSLALVLGNEAHGLSEASIATLDGAVAVPIHGRAESLNVAAAAAIALYAAARGLGLGTSASGPSSTR